MENLQNSIAELSKAFPQEYFDSKSVKNMDFGKMNEFLRELEESLEFRVIMIKHWL